MIDIEHGILELFAESQSLGSSAWHNGHGARGAGSGRLEAEALQNGLSVRFGREIFHADPNKPKRVRFHSGLNCTLCGVLGHRSTTCSNMSSGRELSDAQRAKLHSSGCYHCGGSHRSTSCPCSRPKRDLAPGIQKATQRKPGLARA